MIQAETYYIRILNVSSVFAESVFLMTRRVFAESVLLSQFLLTRQRDVNTDRGGCWGTAWAETYYIRILNVSPVFAESVFDDEARFCRVRYCWVISFLLSQMRVYNKRMKYSSIVYCLVYNNNIIRYTVEPVWNKINDSSEYISSFIDNTHNIHVIEFTLSKH